MSNKAKIPRVNNSECCGCGLCTFALPDVFRLTPEGKSEVYAPEKADEKLVQKTIEDCPCMCIHWYRQ
ncbi:MAG: ferredoxin [Candidatus Heimdallarchaeota archaeon]|nr:ferredoxin [Candidatus Heimdallarchaeota archaeon]